MDLAEEIVKRKERAKKFGLPVPVFAAEVRAGRTAAPAHVMQPSHRVLGSPPLSVFALLVDWQDISAALGQLRDSSEAALGWLQGSFKAASRQLRGSCRAASRQLQGGSS